MQISNSFKKTNWNTDKNQSLLDRYKDLGLIPFSCKVNEILKNNETIPKKSLSNLPSHSTITKFSSTLINSYNGLCLKMGKKIDDDNYVILLDIDNKNDTVDKWFEIVKKHQKTKKFKTPTAITGNDGLHYLFKVPEKLFQKLQNSYTGLNIDGVKIDIDVKGYNGLQLAEPTRYNALNNETKSYKWYNDTIYKYDIMTIPTWIYKIIINSSSIPILKPKIHKNTSNHIIDKITHTEKPNDKKIDLIPSMFEDFKIKPTQEELDYFNILSFDRIDNISTWISLGFLCHSLYDDKTGFKVWNEISKISPKYDSSDIIYRWKNIINKPKKMTKGSLISYAKSDDKEQFEIIKSKYQTLKYDLNVFDDDNEDDKLVKSNNTITIDERYLLDKDKKLEDTSKLTDTVNCFFSTQSSNVSLSIKSPYDTGKTQLLKEIIHKYKPTRILWLSTRITYT